MGGIFVYYIFYNRLIGFPSIFCGILVNKIIKKIIISVFKFERQIYINHPHPPTKVKGKVQQLCTYTLPHSDQKFPVRHAIFPPKQKRQLFALLLLWAQCTQNQQVKCRKKILLLVRTFFKKCNIFRISKKLQFSIFTIMACFGDKKMSDHTVEGKFVYKGEP